MKKRSPAEALLMQLPSLMERYLDSNISKVLYARQASERFLERDAAYKRSLRLPQDTSPAE